MNNEKTEDFSADKGNVEIVKKENNKVTASESSSSVSVSKDGINVKKSGNLVIGSLNIVASPIKDTIKTRHEKHYRSSKFHLFADLGLALLVLVLFVSFLVVRNLDPKVNIGLEISTLDDEVISGDYETFQIEYTNPNNQPIDETSISIGVPDNFLITAISPKNIFNEASNTFNIGVLPAGAKGKVLVEGLVIGEIGSRQVLNVSFNYNFGNKINNILDSFVYYINDSSLGLDIDIPREIYKDMSFPGSIVISNNSSYDISDGLEIVLDSNIVEISKIAYPDAVLNNNSIKLGGLPALESVVVNFEAIPVTSNESLNLVWSSYLYSNGEMIKQKELIKEVSVISPKFSIDINSLKTVVSEGEMVDFVLDYKNEEDSDVSDLKIMLNSSDTAFRIDKLNVPESDKYKIVGNEITFNSAIKKGESESINLEVIFSRKNVSANQEVGVVANLDYNLSGDKLSYKAYSSEIKFLSDLQISSRGVYYSAQGDQLGIGPLPPIVDVPTRYWVFWKINNMGNRLENLSVSAILPENVLFTDQKSLIAGKIRYGDISKKVVWSLDEVDALDGDYKAGFEIEFIPSLSDSGKVVDILKDIKYSAFDTYAEREIEGNLSNINTDLKDDSVASGQGTVLKMNVVR